ncbi:MAG: imidazolonepropionase [Flavobacteriales bacterium]|nr:imidazolonepropionase [Flavobacteriales bacterium]
MKTVIKNISELIQVEETPRKRVAGSDMAQLKTIQDAFVEMEDGIITAFGNMDEWTGIEDWNNTQIIDADGGMVFPSYCDSHTHLVFAASREGEFADRIKGLSYEEIAKKGGGILNSARKLQNASEEELLASTLQRANEIMMMGTGAVEIKSGYGLTLVAELKMLRVIKKLKEISPLTIKSTFLGAHALPQEYKGNKDAYMDLIINEMLPQIAEEGLAEYVDIFCEYGYFDVADTERLLAAASQYNLTPKTHVNQFNIIGGVLASVKYGALSVDHLEVMNDADIKALQETDCMPTLLPSCSFFLGIPYGPARKMIQAGLPVALATDYNPGSTPSGNMNFVASLGCIQLKMTPEEVINATTINTAYAMGVSDELGSIAIGKKANLFITKRMPSYAYLPYEFGHNQIETIIVNGKIQNK